MPSQLAAGTLSPSTFSPSTFSGQHILLTAVIAAALTLVAALALRVRGVDLLAVTALTFAASWLLRRAANMPQLNNDGLAPFSANDVLFTGSDLGRDRHLQRPAPRSDQQAATPSPGGGSAVRVRRQRHHHLISTGRDRHG